MALTAEKITYAFDQNPTPAEQGLVIDVAEMDGDIFLRHRAEAFAGSLAVNHEVSVPSEMGKDERIDTLKEAIELAANGDPRALALLRANVAGDVIERVIKSGHIRNIDMEVSAADEIHQHGQTYDQMQANSLLFASNSPVMRERVEAESLNSIRIKELHRRSLLRDHTLVVFSRTPTDLMSPEEVKDEGFFETMSVSLQATGETERGLNTEVGFVAGVKESGGTPHDGEAIKEIVKAWGLNWDDLDSTEMLGRPVLLHNSLIPNGLIDVVKQYDDAVEALDSEARSIFFGEVRNREDYIEYRESCRQREETFKDKTEAVINEIMHRRHEIQSATDATELLDEVSEKHMVKKAIEDDSINPMVFGSKSAGSILQARRHRRLGNHEMEKAAMLRAIRDADSSSCAGGGKKKVGGWWMGERASEEDEEGKKPWHGGKKYYNTQCNSCKLVKGEVGACRICQDCVNNPPKFAIKRAGSSEKKHTPPGPEKSKPEKVIPLKSRSREKGIGKLAVAA